MVLRVAQPPSGWPRILKLGQVHGTRTLPKHRAGPTNLYLLALPHLLWFHLILTGAS